LSFFEEAPLVDHVDIARATPPGPVADAIDDGASQGLIASIQTVVRGNDDNIRETIANLRVATEDLAQLSDGRKDQPWSLVRSRQPKDRKVPEPNSPQHSVASAH